MFRNWERVVMAVTADSRCSAVKVVEKRNCERGVRPYR